MKIVPETKEEIIKSSLLQPGIYDYEVLEAAPKVSQSGNDMIKLALRVYDEDGSAHFIYDYLLFTNKFSKRKFYSFCEATDLLSEYKAGEITPEMCERKSGKVRISIQEDKDGKYPPQNSVVEYVALSSLSAAAPAGQDIEDEIPF